MDNTDFHLDIVTTADTSGADEAVAALERVKDEALSANTVSSGPNGPNNPPNNPLYSEAELAIIQERLQLKLNEQLVEEELLRLVAQARAAEADLTDLQRQRQIIAQELVVAAQEEAAGRIEVAAAMREEAEVMKLSLTYQQGANLSEAEATALARQRIAAEAQIAAQEQAQIALNATLIAQEEEKLALEEAKSKVYGRGGQAGNLLKNFGVDSGLATTIGISMLAGVELNRVINEMANKMNEASIAAEKQSAEFQKQIGQWATMAGAAKDMADVVKVTDSVNKGMDGMLEKFRAIKGEGSGGFFNAMEDGLKGWSNMLGESYRSWMADNGMISKDTEAILDQQSHLKTSTEQARDAVKDQMDSVQSAGKIYMEFAKKQAAWFDSLKAMPIAEQISALIEKEGELIEKQKGMEEGTKLWSDLAKQIEVVQKAEEKLLTESGKRATQDAKASEEQEKAAQKTLEYDDKIEAIKEKIAGLYEKIGDAATISAAKESIAADKASEAASKAAGQTASAHKKVGKAAKDAGTTALKASEDDAKALIEETRQGESKAAQLREMNGLTRELAKAEAERAAAADKAGPAAIQTAREKEDAAIKIQQLKDELKTTLNPDRAGEIERQLSALAPEPAKPAREEAAPLTDDQVRDKTEAAEAALDKLSNRATPDGDESDLQDTLKGRANAEAPAQPYTPAEAESAKAVSDAAKQDAEMTKQSLDDASADFLKIRDHFESFKSTLTTGTAEVGQSAADVQTGINDLVSGMADGFAEIGTTVGGALTDLQQQIITVSKQLQDYITSQN